MYQVRLNIFILFDISAIAQVIYSTQQIMLLELYTVLLTTVTLIDDNVLQLHMSGCLYKSSFVVGELCVVRPNYGTTS